MVFISIKQGMHGAKAKTSFKDSRSIAAKFYKK
jgi:hypothetical protein